MKNEPNGIIQNGRPRESAVSCIMGNDPESGPDEALAESIDVDDRVILQSAALDGRKRQ
jgi:hypothetical protein